MSSLVSAMSVSRVLIAVSRSDFLSPMRPRASSNAAARAVSFGSVFDLVRDARRCLREIRAKGRDAAIRWAMGGVILDIVFILDTSNIVFSLRHEYHM